MYVQFQYTLQYILFRVYSWQCKVFTVECTVQCRPLVIESVCLWRAFPPLVLQCTIVLHSRVQGTTLHCYSWVEHTTGLQSRVQCITVLQSSMQCTTVLQSSMQCTTVLQSRVQCTTLHCYSHGWGVLRAPTGPKNMILQRGRNSRIVL